VPQRKVPRLVLAVVVLLSPPLVASADWGVGVNGYSVATWGANEGAPDATVYALAQDRAGYLWLGTGAGLFRFDGFHFKPWSALSSSAIPAGPVQALCASRDGSLWVGARSDGHLSRIRGTSVRDFTVADGLPALPIISVVEDTKGKLWVGNDAGLFFLDGEYWRKWPSANGLPDAPVWGTHVRGDGAFFVTTPAGLFRRSPEASRFEEVMPFGSSRSPGPLSSASVAGFLPVTMVRSIVSHPGGRVFVSDFRSGYRPVSNSGARRGDHFGRGLQLIVDRQGNLWVATSGQGVWHVREPGSLHPVVERITAATGLAAEGAFSLLEDRDGNIWAGGTPTGLTRLTPHKVLPFTHEAIVNALAVSGAGMAWIGTSDGLSEVADPDRDPLREVHRLRGFSVRALHIDSQGTLWVATERNLFRVPADQSGSPVTLPGSEQLRQVDSITSHPRLGVLVSDADRGLLRWNGRDGFDAVTLPAEVRGMRILTTYTDRSGHVWVSFAGGRIVIIEADGTSRVLGRDLDAGDYRIVREDAAGVVWLGGTAGITRYENGRAVTLHGDDRFPIRRVMAIIQDRRRRLWIATTAGIFGIEPDALARAAVDSSYRPPYVQYDKSDGLAGVPALLSDSPAVRTTAGALWFVTTNGITILEPRDADERVAPPTVSVDSVNVDDKPIAPLRDVTLAAGTRRLQVEYGSLNLTAPQKTRFRFRLDGVDSDWVDVGTRRQASYTNLSPGRYRFRVAASDTSGAWRESEAAWEFSVAPRFYQTRLFALACTGLVLLTTGLAWNIRLRQERQRFSLILGERARLSREIHDTLLQGLVGIGLQCDALGNELEQAAPATQERFLRLRRETQRYIKEARHAIWRLRSSTSERQELTAVLRRFGEPVTAAGGDFSVVVDGQPVALDEEVERQLERIAQEAITNAAHHARAKRVGVVLNYSPSEVVLRVSDDGCGFAGMAHSEAAGHYGLLSMKERADSIKATFSLASASGSGTQVEVKVPLQYPQSLAAQTR
jgi:signal transduction histidine kinase/ligand-binding sensor domain-containing protein